MSYGLEEENLELYRFFRREMEQGTEPLKLVLQELETSIIDQLDKLSAVKASILRNEERIQRLLRSTGAGSSGKP
jgi:hypothetical protein